MIPTNSKMKTGAPGLETKGQTIRWAHYYDFIVRLALLGKDRALRKMTAEMARSSQGTGY